MRPLLLALALLAPAAARGQMRAAFGITASTLRGSAREETDFSSITRFTAGVGYEVGLRGGLSFRTEVQYVVKGASARTDLDGVPIRATFDLTYLEVPVLLVWSLYRPRGPVPSLYAGPAVAFRLDSRVRYRALSGGPEFTDTDETVRRTGIGFVLGGELGLTVSDVDTFAGVRYAGGLSNARRADPPLRHGGGSLYLGVLF